MIEKANQILKKVFGYERFRSLQEAVITNVLKKNDTLVIMPTGGGKSLCYQIPALLFNGLTIVISPLISLMKDQLNQLEELGIPAVVLNSSLSQEEYRANMGKIKRNAVKLLYLAPETLLKPNILEFLSTLSEPVACLTIDEAHCISEWGHDFRPEYRQIVEVRKRFPQAVCMALTATATQRVREDIKQTLNFGASNQFIAGFDRENLFLKVIPKSNPRAQVLRFLKQYENQPGIIYCFSRRAVDELTAVLSDKGFSVCGYHAGMSEEERRQNQERFSRDDVQIIVATIAFGMGINKSNIRFVVHYDLPKNIESYYQEIGRAGRDGLKADCLLLFGYGDTQKIKYFIDQKDEKEQRIAAMHLTALLGYAESDLCRRIPLLRYFGETYSKDSCDMCDNCLKDDSDKKDITIPAQKFLVTVRKTGERFGAGHISDILRASKSQKITTFQHDQLSTYGIGKDISKKQWFNLSRQFIQKGLLIQDMEHGSLKLTAAAYRVLKGLEKVMGMLEEEREAAPKSPRKSAAQAEFMDKYDQALFNLLKRKRKELADQANLPPYMIFSDRSLMEMAAHYPRTSEQLITIHGVGARKLDNYGHAILTLITDYCDENNLHAAPMAPTSTAAQDNRDNRNNRNNRNEYAEPDAQPKPKTTKKTKYGEIGDLYNSGVSIHQLAQRFNILPDTVLNNLFRFLQAGNNVNPSGILELSTLPPALQADVMEAFSRLGTNHLKPVYDALEGRVDYTQLRILQVYYLSCEP